MPAAPAFGLKVKTSQTRDTRGQQHHTPSEHKLGLQPEPERTPPRGGIISMPAILFRWLAWRLFLSLCSRRRRAVMLRTWLPAGTRCNCVLEASPSRSARRAWMAIALGIRESQRRTSKISGSPGPPGQLRKSPSRTLAELSRDLAHICLVLFSFLSFREEPLIF